MLTLITKTPLERFPIWVDFTGQLPIGTLPASATVVSQRVETGAIDNSVLGSTIASPDATAVMFVVQAGLIGMLYQLTLRVTVDAGSPPYVLEEDVRLYIIESAGPLIIKQPEERWPIGVNFTGKLPAGTAVASATVTGTNVATTLTDNSVLDSTSAVIVDDLVVPVLTGGQPETLYQLSVRATLDAGSPPYVLEERFRLYVKEL